MKVARAEVEVRMGEVDLEGWRSVCERLRFGGERDWEGKDARG